MKIAIASGKGGAGKTSVAASLISVWNAPLLAVDTDVEAPNLHLFVKPFALENSKAFLPVPNVVHEKCTGCGKCRDICHYKALVQFAGHITVFTDMCHGCGACFAVCPETGALLEGARELGTLKYGKCTVGNARFLMGKSRIGESMTPPLLTRLQDKLNTMLVENATDVIIDSPPGVSCPAMTVVRDADMLLLVAEPTPFGFHDFCLAHAAFRKLGVPAAVVMNRAGMPQNEAGDATLRAYCQKEGLPLLAEIPFARSAAELYARSGLLAEVNDEWQALFVHLAEKVQDFGKTAVASRKAGA